MTDFAAIQNRGRRIVREHEESCGVRVRFEGGLVDGQVKWWRQNTNSICVANMPPIMFGVSLPKGKRHGIRNTIYRIDDQPQDDGTYVARVIYSSDDDPVFQRLCNPKPKAQRCYRCNAKPSEQAGCYIPGCPNQ